LKNRSFGATALEITFGEQLWGAALDRFPDQLGGSFGKQPWSLRFLGLSLGRGFSVIILKNNFGEQLRGAILRLCSSIEEFWEAAFGNNLRSSFSSLGEQLFGPALDNNFGERLGEQLCGIGLGSSFVR
jgi:hypothetical protein